MVACSDFAYRDEVHFNILEASIRSGEFECVTLSASASDRTTAEDVLITEYVFICLYEYGVPRSLKRCMTSWIDSWLLERKSQKAVASLRFVFGFRFCV